MALRWQVLFAVVMVLLSHATARTLLADGTQTTSTTITTTTSNVEASAPVEAQQTSILNAAAPGAVAGEGTGGDQKNLIYGGVGGAAGVGGYMVVPILGGLGGHYVLGGYHGIGGGIGGVGGLGGGGIGGGIVKGGGIAGGIVP